MSVLRVEVAIGPLSMMAIARLEGVVRRCGLEHYEKVVFGVGEEYSKCAEMMEGRLVVVILASSSSS